jgi:hypothetical protein
MEEFGAEEERRSRLTVEERMAEGGWEVQCRLEREPAMAILLQPSPLRHRLWGEHNAGRGECPIADTLPRDGGRIMDDYRIVPVSDDHKYFHISCLEKMIPSVHFCVSGYLLQTQPRVPLLNPRNKMDVNRAITPLKVYTRSPPSQVTLPTP